MTITKAGSASGGSLDIAQELEVINSFAKTPLKAEEVYAFAVLLCDNEVDRDGERFTEETLAELRELYVGKTGIADHQWTAAGQKARIYRTELVTEPGKRNALGQPYVYLKGCAYMLRTPENQGLIAEIEGGIKKETSVGCSVARRVCSVCGKETGTEGCTHVPGQEYGGRLCCVELVGAVDAYEWSFVAVPAQKNAGVLKAARRDARRNETDKALERAAELGRAYQKQLRQETERLALLCDRDFYEALRPGLAHMAERDMEALCMALRRHMARRFTPETQLPGRRETTKFDGSAYQV